MPAVNTATAEAVDRARRRGTREMNEQQAHAALYGIRQAVLELVEYLMDFASVSSHEDLIAEIEAIGKQARA